MALHSTKNTGCYILRWMKYFSHLHSAAAIIQLYNGKQPFQLFIKSFFKEHPKYGSRDRKSITHLCYCFFRLGELLNDKPAEDRIIAGLFLCSAESNEVLQQLKPVWNDLAASSIQEKCIALQIPYSACILFPFLNHLSNGTDKEAFNLSHLQQPAVFVRVRPYHTKSVLAKMEQAGIAYRLLADNCVAVAANTKLDGVIDINKEAVIQDYSSQRISEFLQLTITNTQLPTKTWDCCAASGGKSILAKDIFNNIDLVVSDIRASMLINLKKRFAEAGIKNYKVFAADLSRLPTAVPLAPFDLIIADVPCSGSGTWGRTPEEMRFFDEKEIATYSALQRSIVSNIIPFLKTGGWLLYITCSVFEEENEAIAGFIKEHFSLDLVKMEVLKGYTNKADTMFAALYQMKKTG